MKHSNYTDTNTHTTLGISTNKRTQGAQQCQHKTQTHSHMNTSNLTTLAKKKKPINAGPLGSKLNTRRTNEMNIYDIKIQEVREDLILVKVLVTN